jgi:hypothetical protein
LPQNGRGSRVKLGRIFIRTSFQDSPSPASAGLFVPANSLSPPAHPQSESRAGRRALRLTQDFVALAGVKKELTTVRFKKPGKQTWIRVHPDPEYRLSPLATIHLKDDDAEWYVVAPALVGSLQNELTYVSLFTVVDRHGNVSLWPVPLPLADGRDNDWWKSAREAAEHATKTWTRMIANKQLGAYDIYSAPPGMPEPEFPTDKTLADLLKVALGSGYLVDSLKHPIIKRLRGLA